MVSGTGNNSPRNYKDAVANLAESHSGADESILEIWSFDDPAGRVVRFVEVSDAELPAENGVVHAVRFGASPDFPFVSEIAMLSPADWQRVHDGSLKLPESWSSAGARKVRG